MTLMSASLAFVADGPERYEPSADLIARQAEIRAAITAEYADALASAGLLHRLILLWRRRCEICRECERLLPSLYSLW
jgi:hypothetical protein